MTKKSIVFILVACIVMACFADSASAAVIEPDIEPQDSKHRIVKEYIKTTSGTQYNDSKTRKCNWTEKHYKVYQENIGTGSRVFRYNEYKWTWKGYKKVDGSWQYVKTKSGTTRTQTNASDIYSFLTSF